MESRSPGRMVSGVLHCAASLLWGDTISQDLNRYLRAAFATYIPMLYVFLVTCGDLDIPKDHSCSNTNSRNGYLGNILYPSQRTRKENLASLDWLRFAGFRHSQTRVGAKAAIFGAILEC